MPRPAWISTGSRCSSASANTGSRRSSSTVNFWARGCSLMPRAPSARHAPRLVHRALGQVEAGQRHEPAAGRRRPLEHAVVRLRGRPARGRPRAAGTRARRARPTRASCPSDVVEVERHAVLVEPEVRVGVGQVRVLAAAAGGCRGAPVRAGARPRLALPWGWTLPAVRRRACSAPERTRSDDPDAPQVVGDARRRFARSIASAAVRWRPPSRGRRRSCRGCTRRGGRRVRVTDRLQHVRVRAEHDVGAGGEGGRREPSLLRARRGVQLDAPVEVDDDDVGLGAGGA